LFFVHHFKWHTYLTGAFFFAAALFTYEQGFFLPVVLLLFYFLERNKTKKLHMITYSLVMAGVSIAYVVARFLITSEIVGNYEGENFRSLNVAALAANGIRLLLRLFINPANPTTFIFTSIVFFLITAALFLFRKEIKFNRNAVILFGIMILILIAPIISLGIPVTSFESGRFLYIPSIFLVAGLSIAGVSVYYHNQHLQKGLFLMLVVLSCYWIFGKYKASKDYIKASSYASSIQSKVQQHFTATSDTLHIDTLHGSIQRLPVYRLGFKTGVKWLNNNIDTNKIVVRHYVDEVQKK
jgi:hypothetical protein